MAFGGEYLFPEAWKKINDTPVNGVLSKTELNRRGAVEFHSKYYPADDWKAHHARDRQAAVFVQMEKARLEPFRGTEGADDLGFKSRQVEEFHVNRRAAAENRIPNVRSFVSKDLKYQPTATWNKKNSVWNPVETTVAAGHSTRDSLDQFAASNSSGGQNASKNPHAETEWQGFDASAAKDTYTSTRKMAAANRYQTDTPYWSRPEWMRKKN